MNILPRQLRCGICRRWFGRHDPLLIHGDGRTDDTRAVQYALDSGLPLPVGKTMIVSHPITLPSSDPGEKP